MADSVTIWEKAKKTGLFTGLCMPTGVLREYVDAKYEEKTLEELIWAKYDISEEELMAWLEAKEYPEGIRKYVYIGPIKFISAPLELRIEFLRNRIGDVPEIAKYYETARKSEEVHERLKKHMDRFSKKTEDPYYEAERAPAIFCTKEDMESEEFKRAAMLVDLSGEVIFGEVRGKYGLTLEEFFEWMHARGIEGKKIFYGLLEIVPEVDTYLLDYLRETIGDTEETARLERGIIEQAKDDIKRCKTPLA